MDIPALVAIHLDLECRLAMDTLLDILDTKDTRLEVILNMASILLSTQGV